MPHICRLKTTGQMHSCLIRQCLFAICPKSNCRSKNFSILLNFQVLFFNDFHTIRGLYPPYRQLTYPRSSYVKWVLSKRRSKPNQYFPSSSSSWGRFTNDILFTPILYRDTPKLGAPTSSHYKVIGIITISQHWEVCLAIISNISIKPSHHHQITKSSNHQRIKSSNHQIIT